MARVATYMLDNQGAAVTAYPGNVESTSISYSDFRTSELVSRLEALWEESVQMANSEGGHHIPTAAISDASYLFGCLPQKVAAPCLVWLEDGGVQLEWRKDNKFLTVSLYGDGYLIWGGILGRSHRIRTIVAPFRIPGGRKKSSDMQYLLNTLRDHFRYEYACNRVD